MLDIFPRSKHTRIGEITGVCLSGAETGKVYMDSELASVSINIFFFFCGTDSPLLQGLLFSEFYFVGFLISKSNSSKIFK